MPTLYSTNIMEVYHFIMWHISHCCTLAMVLHISFCCTLAVVSHWTFLQLNFVLLDSIFFAVDCSVTELDDDMVNVSYREWCSRSSTVKTYMYNDVNFGAEGELYLDHHYSFHYNSSVQIIHTHTYISI